jgi:transcription antitermination factor NusG
LICLDQTPHFAQVGLELHREQLGIGHLDRAGFSPWYPQVREYRTGRAGRRVLITRPLFAGYCFIVIELQWYQARWSPGVAGILMTASERPAVVPDRVIGELRSRERNGCVVLPEPPGLKPGDPVRVTAGLMAGALGLCAGMRSGERVAILLSILGAERLAIMPAAAVAPAYLPP